MAKVDIRKIHILKEFKEFALKGNIFDLAVGVIIGGAFGKIVTSLVNDILMPLIGIILGGVSFTDLKWVIAPAVGDVAEVAFRYGAFLQSIVDFLIIALSIFLMMKMLMMSRLKKTPDTILVPAPEPPAPEPSREELLLAEIRDLLKEQRANSARETDEV